MGKGVANALAGYGSGINEIIILCRNKSLGEATIKEIGTATSNKKLSYILCDLSRLNDVKKAIEEIQHKHTYLDAIFINAGIGYAAKHTETEDGLDPHFQVNYLSQFMLLLHLLDLLEKSTQGGRVIFNVIEHGKIYWDDLQLTNGWSYKKALLQSMLAKRLFIQKLHQLYAGPNMPALSFIGFEIPKTVWTNQLNIIPAPMKAMATMMKFFGQFITIEKCGEIMAPLFMESREESLKKSGKLITWKKGQFQELKDDPDTTNPATIDRLWETSLDLCADEQTSDLVNNKFHEESSNSHIPISYF